MHEYNLVIIGLGNMASAMLDGFISAGYPQEKISVYTKTPERKQGNYPKIKFYNSIEDIEITDKTIIQFSIKPYMAEEILPKFKHLVQDNVVFSSVMLSLSCDYLESLLIKGAKIYRMMPNIGAQIGKSSNLVAQKNINDDEFDAVNSINKITGSCFLVTDESDIDKLTIFSGSGPALFMKIFEQFAESSTNIGLDEDLTAKILLEIFETTSNLIKEKSLSNIKELRRTITSKGGCTETLITTLEKNNLKSLIDNATLNSFEKIMSFSKK